MAASAPVPRLLWEALALRAWLELLRCLTIIWKAPYTVPKLGDGLLLVSLGIAAARTSAPEPWTRGHTTGRSIDSGAEAKQKAHSIAAGKERQKR